MKNTELKEYIQAALGLYLLEDFNDTTKPNKPGQPGQQGQSPPQPGWDSHVFSIEQLRKIQNLQQVLIYVNTTLGAAKLGEGQGRVVYKLGGNKVLKVAKDSGGQGQNQAEATVCAATKDAFGLFPVVSEINPSHLWLVTEEASAMTEELFHKLTGLPWQTFTSGLMGAFSEKLKGTASEINKQNFINSSQNPFFAKLVRVIKGCKYEPGDIAKLDSWGVINGKPVIVDSGFTEAVNQAYYQGNR